MTKFSQLIGASLLSRCVCVAVCLMLWTNAATGADALSLADAKNQGVVGEQTGGYLGAVASGASTGEINEAAITKLITDVNVKRRAAYQRIASKNKIDVKDVEALAGKKAIENSANGHYVRMPNGQWRMR